MDFRKVGGQEEDQKLLGEGQSRKNETKLGGRAGKEPKWSHKTESVGQTVWRPYAMRLDDDDDTPYFKASANFAVLLS